MGLAPQAKTKGRRATSGEWGRKVMEVAAPGFYVRNPCSHAAACAAYERVVRLCVELPAPLENGSPDRFRSILDDRVAINIHHDCRGAFQKPRRASRPLARQRSARAARDNPVNLTDGVDGDCQDCQE